MEDERRFPALFDRHRREPHVHCHRMLGSSDEAEDAVQEAFLRARRSRATARGQFRARGPSPARTHRDAPGGGAGPRCHHLVVRPPPAVAAPLERLRARWDPVTAARAPAHVTVVHPEELADPAAQVAGAAAVVRAPSRLRYGPVRRRRGGRLHVAVDDLDGGWQDVRDRLVSGPPWQRGGLRRTWVDQQW